MEFRPCNLFSTILFLILRIESKLILDNSNFSDIYSPSPYNLEDHCSTEKTQTKFYIEPWKGAIVQVGYVFNDKGFPKSRSIHECLITIETKKGWSLVAAVEHMKIRGRKNTYNKWECSDYIRFYAPGQSPFRKLIASIDLDFSSKTSEHLCGTKRLKRLDGNSLPVIYDLSTDANSFHTSTNKIKLDFHQENSVRHQSNNSFRIVFTTFKHASEQEECKDKQKCYGKDIFCIDKAYICDGHINCAFPNSATDERLCEANSPKRNALNITSIIIVTLISIVVTGLVICIISTIICKLKSRLAGNSRTMSAVFSNISSQQASAPNTEPEEPLPTYETIIHEDSCADKSLSNVMEGELPPQYETLFPDGPPILKEDSIKNSVR